LESDGSGALLGGSEEGIAGGDDSPSKSIVEVGKMDATWEN